jgi:hypothetical protein
LSAFASPGVMPMSAPVAKIVSAGKITCAISMPSTPLPGPTLTHQFRFV